MCPAGLCLRLKCAKICIMLQIMTSMMVIQRVVPCNSSMGSISVLRLQEDQIRYNCFQQGFLRQCTSFPHLSRSGFSSLVQPFSVVISVKVSLSLRHLLACDPIWLPSVSHAHS